MDPITIVGGGLAGCEAAWQIARKGGRVILHEMKPHLYSPAHRSPHLAEIVCSNSFKSESLENAHGVLKSEMDVLESLILRAARETRVPAGDALAVDREDFSMEVTRTLQGLQNVEVLRGEMTVVPRGCITILATGPLTSELLSQEIRKITGSPLFFYDAISPIVTRESIDFEKVFMASRYGKGGEDYINCPMGREGYYEFVEALHRAERVPIREFERKYLFEGCLPVEELARRGKDTLAFGPLKPVGLADPKTGRQPFAVVQLRQEDRFGSLLNMVGFQTRLKQGEQKRIFQMIPGLEKAEFVRWGSVHRNTFIDSPRLLRPSLQFKHDPCLFFAGQVTGVEGYMESTAMGLIAGLNAHRVSKGLPPAVPPPTTAIGALIHYITTCPTTPFQPMNVNFGLFAPLHGTGREKRRRLAERARVEMRQWKEGLDVEQTEVR